MSTPEAATVIKMILKSVYSATQYTLGETMNSAAVSTGSYKNVLDYKCYGSACVYMRGAAARESLRKIARLGSRHLRSTLAAALVLFTLALLLIRLRLRCHLAALSYLQALEPWFEQLNILIGKRFPAPGEVRVYLTCWYECYSID